MLYLSKQELSFNPEFERHLHTRVEDSQRGNVGGGVFTGVSADIQNDIIECVNSVIQDEIDREITQRNFLSIQVYEITDIATKEQQSDILRFDRKGEVVERFLKFVDVSSEKATSTISCAVKQILSKYWESLKEKLNMQTYD